MDVGQEREPQQQQRQAAGTRLGCPADGPHGIDAAGRKHRQQRERLERSGQRRIVEAVDGGDVGLDALGSAPVRHQLIGPVPEDARQGERRDAKRDQAAAAEAEHQSPARRRLEQHEDQWQREAEIGLDPDERQQQSGPHRPAAAGEVPGAREPEEDQGAHLPLEDIDEGDGGEDGDNHGDPPAGRRPAEPEQDQPGARRDRQQHQAGEPRIDDLPG